MKIYNLIEIESQFQYKKFILIKKNTCILVYFVVNYIYV